MQPNPTIFTPLLIASFAFFFWSLFRRLSLVALGKPEDRCDNVPRRLQFMVRFAFGQLRVLRMPFGFNHLIIFWGFIVLVLVNIEFMINGVFPAIRLSLLPDLLYAPIRYISDIMAFLTLVAVAVALVRRTFIPPYPEARNFIAYAILAMIAIHMVAYLGVGAGEIVLGKERGAAFMPVSAVIARMIESKGPLYAETFFNTSWWLHAVALFVFVTVLIPYTKHLHVLTAIANCFLRRNDLPNVQPCEIFEKGATYGAGQVDRFSWKDLLDSFACTKCGRCQNVCPASITGKSLNPRQIIADILANLETNGPLLKKGGKPTLPLIGAGYGSIAEEAIWSCTSCGACMEACPVFIEHLPKIVAMRRHLVEMEARFPEELLNLFENMEGRSNPWGIAPSERGKWAAPIGGKAFESGRTEYLYYVGCSGSFDSRQKQVTVALGTILDSAGVTWGILGKDELCCGDSLRRLGNEYVFDKMARDNVALFKERGVKKIITQCPHCYSTLKNDYRQYGLDIEVMHQSQLIDKFIREGRIKFTQKIDWVGKVLFHDSCYLGRHNNVYDEPRNVLNTVTGNRPEEFPRSHENALCCGGGGGRMWQEEQSGKRINIERVEEGLAKHADTVCVACPYCLTMFEDGIKDRQAKHIRVMDLAEIVSEGLRMSQ